MIIFIDKSILMTNFIDSCLFSPLVFIKMHIKQSLIKYCKVGTVLAPHLGIER